MQDVSEKIPLTVVLAGTFHLLNFFGAMKKSADLSEFIAMINVIQYKIKNQLDMQGSIEEMRKKLNVSSPTKEDQEMKDKLNSSASSSPIIIREKQENDETKEELALVSPKIVNEKQEGNGNNMLEFYVSMVVSLDSTGLHMFFHACACKLVDPSSNIYYTCIQQIKGMWYILTNVYAQYRKHFKTQRPSNSA